MPETRVTLIPKPDAPIACTLDASEAVDRTSQWHDLLAQATQRERTETGVRLHFPSDPTVASRVADLIVREADCCAFFAFALVVEHGAVSLDVAAPADGAEVLERLFAL